MRPIYNMGWAIPQYGLGHSPNMTFFVVIDFVLLHSGPAGKIWVFFCSPFSIVAAKISWYTSGFLMPGFLEAGQFRFLWHHTSVLAWYFSSTHLLILNLCITCSPLRLNIFGDWCSTKSSLFIMACCCISAFHICLCYPLTNYTYMILVSRFDLSVTYALCSRSIRLTVKNRSWHLGNISGYLLSYVVLIIAICFVTLYCC